MSSIVDSQTSHNSKRLAPVVPPSSLPSLAAIISTIDEHYKELKWINSLGGGDNHSSSQKVKKEQLQLSAGSLIHYDVTDLKLILSVLHERTQSASSILVMQLKRRDHLRLKLRKLCDKMTIILRKFSTNLGAPQKMKFSIEPPADGSNFDMWKAALQSALRLPVALPNEFRSRVWLALAKHGDMRARNSSTVDYEEIFSEITKGSREHKPGTSHETNGDSSTLEAVLVRVILAYSRVNREKSSKNCHFLRLIAKRIFFVMDGDERDTLRVLIYLIKDVMPADYFSRHLQGLAADLAVIRELLRQHYPKLWEHLNMLQSKASSQDDAVVEPPLTNLFCTQWLLTLFDSVLPDEIVLRLWDIMFLEGSEVLLCAAVTIWAVLSKLLLKLSSSAQFYSEMPNLLSRMKAGELTSHDQFMQLLHSIQGPTLMSHSLRELRERYTYNINPFLPLTSKSTSREPSNGKGRRGSLPIQRASVRRLWSDPTGLHGSIIISDDEDNEERDDVDMTGCLSGVFCGLSLPAPPRLMPPPSDQLHENEERTASITSPQSQSFTRDISMLTPGAVSTITADHPENANYNDKSSTCGSDRKASISTSSAYTERMSTDLKALESKFKQVKWRQKNTSLHISTNADGTLRSPASPSSRHYSTPAKQELVVNMLAPQCLQDVSTGGCSQTINHLFYHQQRPSPNQASFTSHPAPITSTTSPQVRSQPCTTGRRPFSHSTSSYPTALSRKSSDAISSYTFETSSFASSNTIGCYTPLGKKTCVLQQVNSKSNDGLSGTLLGGMRHEVSLTEPGEVRKDLRYPVFRSDDSICYLLSGGTCRGDGENENIEEHMEAGIMNSVSTATETPNSPCQLSSPDNNVFFRQTSDLYSQVSQSSGIASITKVHPLNSTMNPMPFKDVGSIHRKVVKTRSATERWIEQTQQLLFNENSVREMEEIPGQRPWQNLHPLPFPSSAKSKEASLSTSVFVSTPTPSRVEQEAIPLPKPPPSLSLVKQRHHSVAQDPPASTWTKSSQIKLQAHQLFTRSRVQFGSQFGLYKSMRARIQGSTVFTS